MNSEKMGLRIWALKHWLKQRRQKKREIKPMSPSSLQQKMMQKTGFKNARFYHDAKGNNYLATTQPTTPTEWTVRILYFGKSPDNKPTEYATAKLKIGKDGSIYISHAEKKTTQTGQKIFKAILNEAITIAQQRGTNIKLATNVKRLHEYYESFGFTFSKRIPTEATLEPPKPPQKKQK